MSTTQAFRNALHVPYADPDVGEVVAAISAGDLYVSDWVPAGAGAAFPNPDKPNQFLVSGPAPDFIWTLIDGVDCGTF
jgi:hypothetical protein